MAKLLVDLHCLIPVAELDVVRGYRWKDKTELSDLDLKIDNEFYRALRKPVTQEPTRKWSSHKLCMFISDLSRGRSMPKVRLWEGTQRVYVVDGAHRISSLIAWVNNDFGDGNITRANCSVASTEMGQRAAASARDSLRARLGEYQLSSTKRLVLAIDWALGHQLKTN